jgi:hypothetical protein
MKEIKEDTQHLIATGIALFVIIVLFIKVMGLN